MTTRILPAVGFSFACYLVIGMLLAILPSYVHLRLGLSTVVAGLVVSAQYVATVLSRPHAGRMTDALGPKRTVLYGLLACTGSGALSLLAAWGDGVRGLGLGSLIAGRLLLGAGESMVATGATMWGIGRVGYRHTARVISWNGIATYGALAAGAPLGVVLERRWGLASVGAFVVALSLASAALALRMNPAAVVHGERMPFRRILWRVTPHGIGLALGGVGFGVIAAFVTLYYAQRGWSGAALALSVYGVCFIGARLLLSDVIQRFGGFPVAAASFAVEAVGLALLGLAPARSAAFAGAALTGFGFSLVFPALGVEAVRHVPAESRGAALGAYTAFVDLSLFVSGPAAGAVIGGYGYPAAFVSAGGAGALALGLTLWLSRRG
ncbi:MFS transporter [Anaeromyxobacter oryzae]|uniref:MFS transporter n=1 Tax=Anaeromyxobacter oryzae TaxID=2918170 RepID=UPI0020C003CC|nr:MFS transporter [Anaeromyxobacter oryzae]